MINTILYEFHLKRLGDTQDKEEDDDDGFRFQDPKYGFINQKGEVVVESI